MGQREMKQASIRELYDYWNRRRGTRPMPERSDIEPSAIRRVLADTFILAVDAAGGHPFRIAGTRVCATFGRELKGSPFRDLWTFESRAVLAELVAAVTAEFIGVVAQASGRTAAGDALDFELLILPLAYRSQLDSRVLGALAPREVPYWLGIHQLGELTLGSFRFLTPETLRPAPASATPRFGTERERRGLVVYDGGHA
jgi:hypothetical protein